MTYVGRKITGVEYIGYGEYGGLKNLPHKSKMEELSHEQDNTF